MPERKPARGRVLIVEDEAYVRDSLAEILRSRGFDVEACSSVEDALVSLGRSPVDVILTDLKMRGASGLDLLGRMRESSPEIPVVMLTGFGTIASAVECMKAGASDYILKPADPEALEVALERAIAARALRREVKYLRSAFVRTGGGAEEPVGRSPAWLRVMNMVRAVAATDSTALLVGESGTGKEVLARLLHRLSARANGPYVRVNCAAVPVEVWESEFFGHRRGSYTGAISDREGRFRLADRGTLFMDEVGAMPVPAQAKMLRVLQDGEFDRLGDEKPTRVDVRIVAATNSDLEADVAAGRFRQDLYYRIDVVRLEVPPLRDRPEDIPLLASHFAAEIAGRLGRPSPPLGPAALEELAAYSWPGNVRELRNVIERAMILNTEGSLSSLDLSPAQGLASAVLGGSPPEGTAQTSELNLRAALGLREKEIVLAALRRSGGVRKEAALLLGIDQRNLGYYLRKHGIDPERL